MCLDEVEPDCWFLLIIGAQFHLERLSAVASSLRKAKVFAVFEAKLRKREVFFADFKVKFICRFQSKI
jgi:hypothetical protein